MFEYNLPLCPYNLSDDWCETIEEALSKYYGLIWASELGWLDTEDNLIVALRRHYQERVYLDAINHRSGDQDEQFIY